MIAAEATKDPSRGNVKLTSEKKLTFNSFSASRSGLQIGTATGELLRALAVGVALCDSMVLLGTCLLTQPLRYASPTSPFGGYTMLLVGVALILQATQMTGFYTSRLSGSIVAQLIAAFRNWSVIFIPVLVFAYVTADTPGFSRSAAVSWYLATLGGVALVRIAARLQVKRWKRRGRLMRTVAIIDMDGSGDQFARNLRQSANDETQILGIFPAHNSESNVLDELLLLARHKQIDETIVTANGADLPAVTTMMRRLAAIPTNVHLCTSFLHDAFPHRDPMLLFGNPVLRIHRRPLAGTQMVIKRCEDVLLSSLLLLALLPLMLGIAVAIRFDSKGPILFRQKRLGLNNRVFEILKFRTMTHRDVEDSIVPQAQRDDARVTRVGRFLRRSSLDELPQLLNVLRGTMSLVGPRPHALPHNEHYSSLIEGYLGRHRVPPGITGWAQVHGLRGETETLDKMRRRVDYDLAYIDNWSLFLDLKILVLTSIVFINDRNAY